MDSGDTTTFIRPRAAELARRIRAPRGFIQFVSGARQVGKTTLVRQVAERSKLPFHFASADDPAIGAGRMWIRLQWAQARRLAGASGGKSALLILDEIQKIPRWTTTVKSLWESDTRYRRPVKVVLLGSAPLPAARGPVASLDGHLQNLHLPHWSFAEMRQAFGWNLKQYLFYGAYPGAAHLVHEPARWARHIRDSLVETTIARDVLPLARVGKPLLLRRVFEMNCAHSGQVLSYRKMAKHLQNKGNVKTFSKYLDLLAGVGAVAGLQNYMGSFAAEKRSKPKVQVFNTALTTAQSGIGIKETFADRELLGNLTESAVGAHMLNAAAAGECELYYWRHDPRQVDFVLHKNGRLAAIEVHSGKKRTSISGLGDFSTIFHSTRSLIVGDGGISVEKFLSTPVTYWLKRP